MTPSRRCRWYWPWHMWSVYGVAMKPMGPEALYSGVVAPMPLVRVKLCDRCGRTELA